MEFYNNILETIGNTPLVKLNQITKNIGGTFLAKVETFNPGNSIKDRMALKMIEDAEKEGKLKPGGTVVEGTSGNTGMGLALVCIVKGYKLICTLPDKQSKEKIDILRAMGADVIVTPTNVAPDDPRSYYSVAKRISEETPNSFYCNQYDNLSNLQAHYETTGPEIWEQTDGKITHLVVGVGTGGTISGCAKYLKEKNPDIKIFGIDTYGSVFKKFHETGEFDNNEIYSYLTEGIGEDILPQNVDFKLIDLFEKVTDKDGMLYTRRLAQEEGIFVGNSAGCAVAGLVQLREQFNKDDVVVVIFHDHGSRYVGKIFNDDWMRDRGFLDPEKPSLSRILEKKKSTELIYIDFDKSVEDAAHLLTSHNISQLPVKRDGIFVGSVSEGNLFSKLIAHPELKTDYVESVMEKGFEILKKGDSLEMLSSILSKSPAVLIQDDNDYRIVTKYDVLQEIV